MTIHMRSAPNDRTVAFNILFVSVSPFKTALSASYFSYVSKTPYSIYDTYVSESVSMSKWITTSRH